MSKRHDDRRDEGFLSSLHSADVHREAHRSVPQSQGEQITESEQAYVWLEAIFEGSRDAIFISDAQSAFVAVNRAACGLTGYSRQELLGMQIPDLHDEEDLDAFSSHHKPILEGKELLTSAWLRRKDGHKIYIDFSNRRMEFLGRKFMHTVARDVTAFHQAQENLHRAKEYAEAAVEAAGLLALELDAAGHITAINEAAAMGMGLAEEEILGRHFLDLLTSSGGDGKTAEEFKRWQTGRAQQALRIEESLATPSGTLRYIVWTINRVDEEKEPAGIVCLGLDLTERHRIEESLKESEERYRKLVELSPDGIALQSEGRLIYANPTLLKMAGAMNENDLIGKLVIDFVHPDFVPLAEARRQQILEIWKPAGWTEIKLVRLDGSLVDAEVSAAPILFDGKTVLQHVVRDISERKTAEENLRKVLRAVEQIPSAVVITDSAGRIEFANAGFVAITGHSREEVLDREVWSCSLFQRADASGIDSTLLDAFSSQSEWKGEFQALRRDGGVYRARLCLSPVNDQEGKVTHLVLTCEDVTESRRMEERMMMSQKLEAIGTLAGGVAHDFNNLLTVINGYSDIILDNLPADDPIRPDLDQIKKAGQKAASLTAQLLAFGRKQIIQPSILDLNSIVEESEKMLRRLLREDIEVIVELDLSGCRIKADPGQISQVVLNIAVNARDAMPEGGSLLLRTATTEFRDEFECCSERLSPGRYALLEITDSGCGMNPVTLSRIFEPFFTTKEAGKGTGLGMSTVYGIVTQSGGDICVASEVGKGTRVQVYLPIAGKTAPSAAESQSPAAALSGTETILLVEDDANLRALSAKILTKYGYRVLIAADGVDALLISADHPGPIDLLISDMVMPRMNGRELKQRISALRPAMKCMFISGYSEEEIHFVRDSTREVPLLLKPFTPESLAQKVRAVLETHS